MENTFKYLLTHKYDDTTNTFTIFKYDSNKYRRFFKQYTNLLKIHLYICDSYIHAVETIKNKFQTEGNIVFIEVNKVSDFPYPDVVFGSLTRKEIKDSAKDKFFVLNVTELKTYTDMKITTDYVRKEAILSTRTKIVEKDYFFIGPIQLQNRHSDFMNMLIERQKFDFEEEG